MHQVARSFASAELAPPSGVEVAAAVVARADLDPWLDWAVCVLFSDVTGLRGDQPIARSRRCGHFDDLGSLAICSVCTSTDPHGSARVSEVKERWRLHHIALDELPKSGE